uniref:Uncharacterized protein n=1 Tax=Oxyrrhis marina TaxID=2969 RepID=A0A7S4GPJ5_OXYMA
MAEDGDQEMVPGFVYGFEEDDGSIGYYFLDEDGEYIPCEDPTAASPEKTSLAQTNSAAGSSGDVAGLDRGEEDLDNSGSAHSTHDGTGLRAGSRSGRAKAASGSSPSPTQTPVSGSPRVAARETGEELREAAGSRSASPGAASPASASSPWVPTPLDPAAQPPPPTESHVAVGGKSHRAPARSARGNAPPGRALGTRAVGKTSGATSTAGRAAARRAASAKSSSTGQESVNAVAPAKRSPESIKAAKQVFNRLYSEASTRDKKRTQAAAEAEADRHGGHSPVVARSPEQVSKVVERLYKTPVRRNLGQEEAFKPPARAKSNDKKLHALYDEARQRRERRQREEEERIQSIVGPGPPKAPASHVKQVTDKMYHEAEERRKRQEKKAAERQQEEEEQLQKSRLPVKGDAAAFGRLFQDAKAREERFQAARLAADQKEIEQLKQCQIHRGKKVARAGLFSRLYDHAADKAATLEDARLARQREEEYFLEQTSIHSGQRSVGPETFERLYADAARKQDHLDALRRAVEEAEEQAILDSTLQVSTMRSTILSDRTEDSKDRGDSDTLAKLKMPSSGSSLKGQVKPPIPREAHSLQIRPLRLAPEHGGMRGSQRQQSATPSPGRAASSVHGSRSPRQPSERSRSPAGSRSPPLKPSPRETTRVPTREEIRGRPPVERRSRPTTPRSISPQQTMMRPASASSLSRSPGQQRSGAPASVPSEASGSRGAAGWSPGRPGAERGGLGARQGHGPALGGGDSNVDRGRPRTASAPRLAGRPAPAGARYIPATRGPAPRAPGVRSPGQSKPDADAAAALLARIAASVEKRLGRKPMLLAVD